jgi:rare lipoprotein A
MIGRREGALRSIVLGAFAAAFALSAASADQYGVATYYRNPWHGGLIAAHLTLPFGTRVQVTNLDNGRSVAVVIVDRGPYAPGRIIDVSTVAAGELGMLRAGVAHVRLEWTPLARGRPRQEAREWIRTPVGGRSAR